MSILDMMKEKKISTSDLAKELDISVSQIYKWNKEGISRNNKYFNKLQELLPGLQPKETPLRTNGTEDRRYNSGKKKKTSLYLKDTSIETPEEQAFQSTLFPKIIKRRQAD